MQTHCQGMKSIRQYLFKQYCAEVKFLAKWSRKLHMGHSVYRLRYYMGIKTPDSRHVLKS